MSAPKVDVLAWIRNVPADNGHKAKERDNVASTVAELIEAAAGSLGDLQAMVAAADRGEVWTVNAGTRLRLGSLVAALANIGPQP